MPSTESKEKQVTFQALTEILRLKYLCPDLHIDHYDEVYPGIYLGDMKTAKNIFELEELKITHVLNAAHWSSPFSDSETSELYYSQRNFKCEFMGIPAQDLSSFRMCDYFDEASDFIHEALNSNGKVYVHCQVGVSRSATVVIAYLMIKQNMTAIEAVDLVRQKRGIFPNDGFLQQIVDLDFRLQHPPNCFVRNLSFIVNLLRKSTSCRKSKRNTFSSLCVCLR